MVKASRLVGDVIIQDVNTGSAWVRRHNGIRLTHVPSRLVLECCEHDSQHKNLAACYAALPFELSKLIK